jgi:hypothetical protein
MRLRFSKERSNSIQEAAQVSSENLCLTVSRALADKLRYGLTRKLTRCWTSKVRGL